MSNGANFQERIYNMKKVSLFVAALLATASTYASAQAPVAVAAAPAAVPVSQPCPCPKAFQGFHLGGNIGYGVGVARTNLTVDPAGPPGPIPTSNKLGVQGFDGGLNVGYTHRFGNFALGLEGVFNWASSKGQFATSLGLAGLPGFGFTDQVRLNNSIQVRANIGYAICNLVMPKIILGWDNSQWTRTINDVTDQVRLARQRSRYNSFLWGLGVDFLLAKHVIGGFEYTGTIGNKKSFGPVFDLQGNSELGNTRPQYNKFALVIKFIY